MFCEAEGKNTEERKKRTKRCDLDIDLQLHSAGISILTNTQTSAECFKN